MAVVHNLKGTSVSSFQIGKSGPTITASGANLGVGTAVLTAASFVADTTPIAETSGGTGTATFATGDILYSDAANSLAKLAAGTNTHVLTLAAGVPTWAAPATSGTVTGTGTDNFIATWNGTGAIDADANSFLVANALDKTATETITGVWSFDTPLSILADINTATPPVAEAVTGGLAIFDADRTDVLGQFAFLGNNNLIIQNAMHGGEVRLTGQNAAGTDTDLLTSDPDNFTRLYYAGAPTISTQAGGIYVADSGVGGDPFIGFYNDETFATRQGFLQFTDTFGMYLRSETVSGEVRLEAKDSGSVNRTLFYGDPDGNIDLTPNTGGVRILGGGALSIHASAAGDFGAFSHDGTDFNTDFTLTTDWNITGATAIQAGTTNIVSGNLFIESASSHSVLVLTKNATAVQAKIQFKQEGNVEKFSMGLSSDTDDDFFIARYNDSGVFQESTLIIDNVSGVSAFANAITATTFNGVALTTAGAATNFLNETGAYSAPPAGTVTSVTGGVGVASTGGTTPSISLTVDELAEKVGAVVGTDRLVGTTGATNWAETISGIPLSIFSDDLGHVENATHTGDVAGATVLTIQPDAVTMDMIVDIATDTFLGRVTAATGTVEVLTNAQAKTALDLTGTNSGDQTITLTGDVTGSGTGSFAATIGADTVTMDKIVDIATDTFLGRVTAATGTVEVLTNAQAKTALDLTGTNSGDNAGVTSVTGGVGIDSTGGTTPDLTVDLGEVTAVVFDPAVDFVPIIDGGITGTTQKDAWSDIATLIAGSGITATAGVLSVAAPGTGTVTSSGSPLVNEVAVFTTATDIDSDSTFTWDGTTMFATNVTGTNIGGITQANLVDKTAAETISGQWIFQDKVQTDDSTTVRAGFQIFEGVAPTSPLDGDIWVTAAGGFFVRLNGVSVDLAAGSGTVTSVSVVSANGLAGTVATATTTPAITLSTTINSPVLAGNGTAISAATTTGTGSTAVLSAAPTLTGVTNFGTLISASNSVATVTDILLQANGNFGAEDDMNFYIDTENTTSGDEFSWRANAPGLTSSLLLMTLNDSGNLIGTGTISGFTTYDGIDIATDVAANTAKVTNATHTGQVTGATALALDVTAITAQPASGAIIAADTIITNDGGVLSETTFTQLNTYFDSSLGFGNVSNTGTPVNNQLAVWTNATTVEGDANLSWDGTILLAGGVLQLTERAANTASPAGGRGEIWVKTGALGGELMYTEGDQDKIFTAYNVIETVYHHDQTITAADPGAGNMRWNSLTPASVTNIYLDDLDETGRDAGFLLGNLADGDILTMRSMWSDIDYFVCSVNGAPTDNTGWWTIPVTVIHTNSVPTTGDPMHITVEWQSQAPGGGVPTTITVADESADTTCFPLFVTAATGDLGPKTGTNITFNSATGAFTATSKSFLIDHPTKPGKKLQYGSLEGPEHGVYVRGRLTDNDTIELPDYWMALVDPDSITVNLTAMGSSQDLFVQSIADNKVTVGGGTRELDCFYTVYAERVDVDKLEVEID